MRTRRRFRIEHNVRYRRPPSSRVARRHLEEDLLEARTGAAPSARAESSAIVPSATFTPPSMMTILVQIFFDEVQEMR